MSQRLSVHEAAEIEIIEAADYYDLASPGLGDEFIDEVESTIASISEWPEASPLIRGGARKRPVRGFPYSLVYSISTGEIRILAVAHQRRRPYYWRSRH